MQITNAFCLMFYLMGFWQSSNNRAILTYNIYYVHIHIQISFLILVAAGLEDNNAALDST